MDIPIIWLIIILIILIFLSAFFSSSETAMMSINHYRLRNLVNKNNARAKLTQKLLKNTDSLIGAILLGNNFVNIFAASITTILAIRLFGEGSIFFASIMLTIIILIFAETTPKTFAVKNPEKVALLFVPLVNLFVILLAPLTTIINHIVGFILKIIGIKKYNKIEQLSADELKLSVMDAKTSIADNYHQILLNIIDLKDVSVEDVMIPKTELIGFDIDNIDEITKVLQRTNHTRLLVYQGDKEHIIGILHMRDVLNLYAKQQFNINKLRALVSKAYFIPEGVTLATQLAQFQKHERRLGLVVDEYGEVKGMIVLEDILEEIVGQFTSNVNEKIQDVVKQSDNSYLLDPSINLHKLSNILNIEFNTKAKTLNGLILDKLQSVPKRHLSIKIDNIVIEIIQIDDNGIKLVNLKTI